MTWPAAGGISALLAPRSIAVVGVSASGRSTGSRVLENLQRLNYGGHLYPVNPKYDEVAGLRCFPSLSAIPGDVEAAFIGLPTTRAVDVLEEAGRRGVRGVVINASGFADAGPEGVALQHRLSEVALRFGVAVCGPNNMGVVNWLENAALWTGALTRPTQVGTVGVISQSGSVSIIFASDDRGLGVSTIISSGNEAVLTSADYLGYLVSDDRITLVLHYAEEIKNPRAYAAAAQEAQRRGKPIIVLKVGRTERGRRATFAHTGSLAGADEDFDAFCRKYGLIRVSTLDEMLETAVLFTTGRPMPSRGRVCVITMSGGQSALISDLAVDEALPLAELEAPTRSALAELYPPYTTISNPFDAWGAGWDADAYRKAVRVLMRDPQVGVIASVIDPAMRGDVDTAIVEELVRAHLDALLEGPPGGPPSVLYNNVSAGLNPAIRGLVAGSGIAYLQGTDRAIQALGHWVRLSQRRGARSDGVLPTLPLQPPKHFVALLSQAKESLLNEQLAGSLLARYGIPIARSGLAKTVDEATELARRIGFPVVIKVVSAGLPHKSDVGGVMLNVRSADEVRSAVGTIQDRVRRARPDVALDGIMVQEMLPEGLEMYLGVSVGPYGPSVLVGLGGIYIEVVRDVASALAPVDSEEAEEMLARLKGHRLLEEWRGRPRRDTPALVAMIRDLSRLAIECGPWLAAVDINPVIVQGEGRGACAADALVEVRP